MKNIFKMQYSVPTRRWGVWEWYSRMETQMLEDFKWITFLKAIRKSKYTTKFKLSDDTDPATGTEVNQTTLLRNIQMTWILLFAPEEQSLSITDPLSKKEMLREGRKLVFFFFSPTLGTCENPLGEFIKCWILGHHLYQFGSKCFDIESSIFFFKYPR